MTGNASPVRALSLSRRREPPHLSGILGESSAHTKGPSLMAMRVIDSPFAFWLALTTSMSSWAAVLTVAPP